MSASESFTELGEYLERYKASKMEPVAPVEPEAPAFPETRVIINDPPEEPLEAKLGRKLAQFGRGADRLAAKTGWRLTLGLCVLTTNAFQFGISHYGHHEHAGMAAEPTVQVQLAGVAEGNL